LRDLIQKKIYFDDGALGFLIILLISQLFFTNGIYLFVGCICFWSIFSNLQQPLKPSVFTIMLIYHTIQIMAGVWLSNFVGKDINFRSEHTDMATIFSYIGLIALFAPIIYYQNKIPHISLKTFKAYADRLSIGRTFNTYLIVFFSMNTLAGVAFVVPGLSQVIFSFVNIKWFFFLLFGFQVILKKQMVKQFGFFILLEFSLGLFSYFSDFKTVMFFGGFIAIVFLTKVNFRQIVIAAIAIYCLFYVGVVWTSIKGEYRSFLNQGSNSQNVSVGQEDAMNKLVELTGNQEEGSFDASAVSFFERLQYTYHLAKTMDMIPATMPYEYGGNIAGILEYVTTPRIINPNKPAYEASKKASKYTGISYAGAKQGVSFSLGYFADCYIDFGYYGMFIPLMILGFIYGSTYFYFVRRSSPNFIFNYAVVGAMFMEFNAYEADGTYLMGRLFATLVTFFVLKLFFFPWLYNYLKVPVPRKEVKEELVSAVAV
jgi:hypothetical protein